MAKAYSYVRFSTPDQEKGDSLRRQTERSKAYCKEHGLTLDDSLMADKGISAYKGSNQEKGSLGKFLKLIEAGKIEKGSILIVENLDRLSRQTPLEALNLFSKIISAGVKLVTLMDGQTYTTESIEKNPSQLFISLGVMIRANEESKTKSERIVAAWHKKRELGLTEHKPLTAKCPGWLKLVAGKFILDPDRAKLAKRVISMALAGQGAVSICQTLNREGLPTLSQRGKHWEFSTVQHLITSRTLVGEYQPKKMVDGRAKACVDPIPGYYPSLITEAEFYRLQAVLAKRKTGVKGRASKTVTNLFGQILKSGHDGATMVLQSKRRGELLMRSGNATRGISSYGTSFQYYPFEVSFLNWVKEIDLNATNGAAPVSELDELQGRLAEVLEKITKVETQLDSSKGKAFDRVLALLAKLNEEEAELKQKIEAERATAHSPLITSADLGELIEQMRKATSDELFELRTKLRAAIQAVVKEIRVYIYVEGFARVCIAHVKLNSGGARFFEVHTDRKQHPWSSSTGNYLEVGDYYDDVVKKWCDKNHSFDHPVVALTE